MALSTDLSWAAVRYNVTDLGSLPGYHISRAWSLNNKGQIVGQVVDANRPENSRAVLFDPMGAGNNIDLGTLGGPSSVAISIDSNGQIVGTADTNTDPLTWYLTIFDPNGSGNNTKLNRGGCPWESNDYGQIAGCIRSHPQGESRFVRRAALFEPNSEPNTVLLGSVPGYSDSEAMSINNTGLIVGYACNPTNWQYPYSQMRAVLFDPTGNGSNIDLGTLAGYDWAVAFSINDRGLIVGRANNDDMSVENWNPRPVLFDRSGEGNNIDLGTLPGYDSAEAFSISNKGQIVGRALINEWPRGSWTDTAVLFDSTGAGHNIKLEEMINPTLGWRLSVAWAINDYGWIIGWGHNGHSPPGYQNSFLLTPVPAGPADLRADGAVDLQDFAVLAAAWKSGAGEDNWNALCDISEANDNLIDERDLAVFAENYLANAM